MNIENNDIDNIVNLLDQKCNDGVGRIKLKLSDEVPDREVVQQYHHGRCDVGSPWAKGTVPNFRC